MYVIREPGEPNKIGQSMKGVNKYGQSKRAEAQARKLRRRTGDDYKSEVREIFATKKAALAYETRFIETFRRMYGQDKLPGNKGVH